MHIASLHMVTGGLIFEAIILQLQSTNLKKINSVKN